MLSTDPESTAARIVRQRKIRGLSQRGLANLSGVSYSLLTKIEQGARQTTPAVLAAIARALAVPVTQLTGQPYLAELRADQLDSLIQPIRESLDVYDLGADPEVTPRRLGELAADANRLCLLVRATDLRTAAAELPALILELTTAAHTAGTDRAWSTLASAYRTAYDIATKLGYADLAAIALDRMDWAAQRASDPIVASVRQYLRALAYLRAGQYRTGRRLVAVGQATAALAEPSMVRDAVMGQISLGGAVLAARDRDGERAQEYLTEAEHLAERTGEAPQVHWLSFGPTNVSTHRFSVLAEQDKYAQALEVARTIRIPDDWPVSRASHHIAEVARAQLWTGRTDAAFQSLVKARALAPQQIRYSPTVHDTVEGLLRAQRSAPDTLANYAVWVGTTR
jgi:transcriptional regulator with XRE-family HTH domain